MPNLSLISSLREKYDKENPHKYHAVKEFVALNGVKQYAINEHNLQKNQSEVFNFKKFTIDKPELVKYFENKDEVEVVLLYIDITNFSSKCSGLNNIKIEKILTDFYQNTIPKIYEFGGEIEKIMGDGIIAVFGMPFSDEPVIKLCINAENCAASIIKANHNRTTEVKIALHNGPVMYYAMPLPQYEEYTIIGSTLTELFRLESVSEKNSINFFEETIYWGLSAFRLTTVSKDVRWSREQTTTELKGLGNKTICRFEWD